jgi:putative membrane protein insertion efficiency factor
MKKVLIYFIKAYKIIISPLLPDSCRFYPTCSEYAVGAIDKYGILKGSIKSIYRILRCNPFNKGGYDPVR